MVAVYAQLAAANTAQNAVLAKMTVGTVTPYLFGYKATTNFAVDYEKGTDHNSLSGTGHQEIDFGFTGNLQGDIVTGAALEIQLPAIRSASDTIAMWVWGVGYAMVRSAELRIGGNLIERLHGDYMEMASELHSRPGTYMEDSVLKLDQVTIPDMSLQSTSMSRTLYVPLPFFFTRSEHCVLPIGRFFSASQADGGGGSNKEVRITVNLRQIADVTVGLPVNSTAQTETTPLNASGGALTYGDIGVRLWLQTVFMSPREAKTFTRNGYKAVCTTAFSLNADPSSSVQISGGSFSRSALPFRHPVKCLMWAVGDQKRLDATLDVSTSDSLTIPKSDTFLKGVTPYTGANVRSLYGVKLAHGQNTQGDAGAQAKTDWSARREGTTAIAFFDGSSSEIGSGSFAHEQPLLSNRSPKCWRNDGLAGCGFLPKNRFDYRAVSADGVETEPVKSITLKLHNKERWSDQIGTPSTGRASYFRMVQPMMHFNRIPRKGIYAYSFAKNASSPLPSGSINMQNIYNRDLTITLNNTTQDADLLMYSEAHNVFSMDFKTQSYKMKFPY